MVDRTTSTQTNQSTRRQQWKRKHQRQSEPTESQRVSFVFPILFLGGVPFELHALLHVLLRLRLRGLRRAVRCRFSVALLFAAASPVRRQLTTKLLPLWPQQRPHLLFARRCGSHFDLFFHTTAATTTTTAAVLPWLHSFWLHFLFFFFFFFCVRVCSSPSIHRQCASRRRHSEVLRDARLAHEAATTASATAATAAKVMHSPQRPRSP